ncbi:cyclase family protein [Aquabacter sp. CN5-332]|uniref:cyclase family protein n=1 Tax=Aquabacter sp. CN5-332 TaxID=3156608 RepID=UPI0032B5FC4B
MLTADDVIDLTMPFYEGMPTDDLGPKVWERMGYAYARQLQGGTQTRAGRLVLTTDHTGTHIDGPLRFNPQGMPIEQVPLERFLASARLLDLRSLGRTGTIDVPALMRASAGDLQPGEAAVLWTGHDRHIADPGYFWRRPELGRDAAEFLASRRPALVAADFPGLGRPGDDRFEVKRILHKAGILTMEQLRNLEALEGRIWHLYGAPLRIRGGAGSIIRACGLVNWRARGIVDLTLDLHGAMPSLGAIPQFWTRANHELTAFFSAQEVSYQTNAMMLNEHAGTHLDAPSHFDEDGLAIDDLRLSDLVARARMFDMRHKGPLEAIGAADLEAQVGRAGFEPGDAAVIWTGHCRNYDRADYGYHRPFITADGADWIVERKASVLVTDLVGLDEHADLTSPVHNKILLAGICMLQVTTNLGALADGGWEICAFPLKFVRGTGAPLRAFAARI